MSEPQTSETAPQRSTKWPWIIALFVPIVSAASVSFAFAPSNAGHRSALIPLALSYALLSALGIERLRRRGKLAQHLKPHRGDLTLGALLAALIYGLASATTLFISSQMKPQTAWIMRLYLQLGERSDVDTLWLGAAVFGIAALEEMSFRGLLMDALADVLSPARAVIVCAVLFALAHTPTLFLLSDPYAGPNPLLVAAGFFCSLVWGFLVLRYKRLTPALFCHAFFSWAVVEFPIFRP